MIAQTGGAMWVSGSTVTMSDTDFTSCSSSVRMGLLGTPPHISALHHFTRLHCISYHTTPTHTPHHTKSPHFNRKPLHFVSHRARPYCTHRAIPPSPLVRWIGTLMDARVGPLYGDLSTAFLCSRHVARSRLVRILAVV